MNRLTSARTELYEAIAPVLPGRVAPMPPAGKPYPAPYIWLDHDEGTLANVGQRTQLTVTTIPVWISYDGAVKAQIAGLADLVAQVWDATLTVPAARPTGWLNSVIDVGGTPVTGKVLSVDVTLGALTLCVAPVVAVPIPPDPVPVP